MGAFWGTIDGGGILGWALVENWEYWYFLPYRLLSAGVSPTRYFMEIIYRCSFMRSFFCRLPAFFSASDTRSRLNLKYQFDYRHGPDLLLNGWLCRGFFLNLSQRGAIHEEDKPPESLSFGEVIWAHHHRVTLYYGFSWPYFLYPAVCLAGYCGRFFP